MNTPSLLNQQLDDLKLSFLKAHYIELAQQAAENSWTHVEYLTRLIDGQYQQRRQRTIELRVEAARFPVLKTLEQFRWDWPKKINRLQVQNLFRLDFLAQQANVIFLGTVGLGKTHLASALGYTACLEGPHRPLRQRHPGHQRTHRRAKERRSQKQTQRIPSPTAVAPG